MICTTSVPHPLEVGTTSRLLCLRRRLRRQVYDRVLASDSIATLLALFLIVAFLYAMMGLLDHVRGRILARIGAGFQAEMDDRVFAAVLRPAEIPKLREKPAGTLRDLAWLHTFRRSCLYG